MGKKQPAAPSEREPEAEGRWLAFLEAERNVAREAVLRLSATAAALPGAILAVFLPEDFRRLVSSEGWLVIFVMLVWAEFMLIGLWYAWYQYSGTAKSILRGYVYPNDSYPNRMVVEFRHLLTRDVGALLFLMSPWTRYHDTQLRHQFDDVLQLENKVLGWLKHKQSLPTWEAWFRSSHPQFAEWLRELFGWPLRDLNDLPPQAGSRPEKWLVGGFLWLRRVFYAGVRPDLHCVLMVGGLLDGKSNRMAVAIASSRAHSCDCAGCSPRLAPAKVYWPSRPVFLASALVWRGERKT